MRASIEILTYLRGIVWSPANAYKRMLAGVSLALVVTGADGAALDTPVTVSSIDPAACVLWDGLLDIPLSSQTAITNVLWTQDSLPNPAQFSFGTSTNPGPRQMRIGFHSPMAVGSVLVVGRGRLSLLREAAAYPGDLEDDSQWISAQRIRDGEVSGASADEVAYQAPMTVWLAPPGTATRAFRITLDALYLDEKYNVGVPRIYVFNDRVANLAPAAFFWSPSNPGDTARLNDEFGGFLWDNTPPGAVAGSGGSEVVSSVHPEILLLLWPEAVELAGLATFETGLGAAEIQAFVGPADRHPRSATESDWQTVMSLGGFGNDWARVAGPLIWPFPSTVSTRALRLRIVEPSGSPFHNGQTVGGKRVWLNEVMALKPLGQAPPETGIVPAPFSNADPVPVSFTLPEASVVTLVIEDVAGRRVRNLMSETPFPAGTHTVWWDGFDDRGILSLDANGAAAFFDPHGAINFLGGLNRAQGTLVSPGTYRVRGLRREPINLRYQFTVYNSGEPPWPIQNGVVPVWDTTGQWLADHYPPRDLVFLPGPTNQVFIASPVAESGDGMVWVDLEGRKLAGRRGVQGWTCGWEYIEEDWTSASHVARDDGPDALPNVAAYLAVAFHDGLRIHAMSPDRCLRRVIKRPWDQPQDADILGIAARDRRLVVSVPARNELWFIDAASGQYEGAAALEDPRGVAFDSAGRLLALSGHRLLRFDLLPGSIELTQPTEVAVDLEDPRDVELDGDGNLYVSQHGTRQNVTVLSEAGVFLREIGVPGPVGPGPYDEQHMHHPEGMTITPDGTLWVAEFDHAPKRVSIWKLDGAFVKAFYGPTKYGGGGQLDPIDRTRFYLFEQEGGMQFELDWTNGTSRLASVYYRRGSTGWEMPIQDWGRDSAGPETPIYFQGRQYLTDAFVGQAGALPGLGLWVLRHGVAVPVAACGQASLWSLLASAPLKDVVPAYDPVLNPLFFIWSDLNQDQEVQSNELQFRHERVGAVTVNQNLEFATGEARLYRPIGFTVDGVPVYDVNAGEDQLTGYRPVGLDNGGVLATTNQTTLLIGGPIRGVRNGEVIWGYASDWPSLNATWALGRPPLPAKPGQLIGTTRLLGLPVIPTGSDVGEIFGINGNFGNCYLFTTDGLLVATLFHDTRVAPGWRMPFRQRGMLLNDISLGEEAFHPCLSQVENGEIYLTAGHNHSSIVQVEGLETARRFDGPDIVLTAEWQTHAHSNLVAREAARIAWQGRETLFISAPTNAPVLDGLTNDWAEANWVSVSDVTRAALAVAAGRLYVAVEKSPSDQWFNEAEDPVPLLHSGGALDLVLGTNPSSDPGRQEPVAGDLRVLVTRRNGLLRALLMRPVTTETGTPGEFASSWRTNRFESVEDISHLVELGFVLGGQAMEMAIPLSTLGLDPLPGPVILGDLGVLRGKAGQLYERVCWHNKAANVLLDLAGDSVLTPQLWGYMQFPATPPVLPAGVPPALPTVPTNITASEGAPLLLDFRRGTGLRREFFGWPAQASLDSLTNRTLNPRYPNYFEEDDVWVSDLDIPMRETLRYQAERLRAWLIPPLTGDYRFWISSEEPSALLLSTNASSTRCSLIAWVPDWSAYRQWDRHPSQQSALIHLEAGRPYCLEALRVQSFSDEHFTIRWQLPDGTREEPLPASRLVPLQGFASPANRPGPGQQFEFSLDAGLTGAAIDPQSGVFSWTPPETMGGTTQDFTVRLTDLANPTSSVARTFTIGVAEVNGVPVPETPPLQVIVEETTLAFTNRVTDPDLPTNVLRFALVGGAPGGLRLESDTGVLTWTPTEADGPGTNTVEVIVTDDGVPPRSATNVIQMIVLETNRAPTLEPVSDWVITPGQTLEIQWIGRDPDLPANTLRYVAIAGPTNATMDSVTGLWRWTPGIAEAGQTHEVNVEVRDDAVVPMTAQATFGIRVREVRTEFTSRESGFSGDGFSLRFRGEAGLRITIEASDDLEQWIELEGITVSEEGTATFTDTTAPPGVRRFYRLRWAP